MARTSFQGPVRSLAGFYPQGPNAINTISGNITLGPDATTGIDAYAGRIQLVTSATAAITLPLIDATADPNGSGPGYDVSTSSNLATGYTFYIATASTNLTIVTSGSDVYIGALPIVATGTAAVTAYASSTNTTITLNGTTKGGVVGSWITLTPLQAGKWYVQGFLIGSGTIATPFS